MLYLSSFYQGAVRLVSGKRRCSLDGFDVRGFLTFFALRNVKTYALAFIQGLETFTLNRAEMYEYIAAFFLFDEAEAFAFVKPFDFTF